jgi:hypothetical protein
MKLYKKQTAFSIKYQQEKLLQGHPKRIKTSPDMIRSKA